jgi:glycogen debranching enzyme
LLAFSGVDGPTPYHRALVARTSMSGCGVTVNVPGDAELVFSDAAPTRCRVTSDIVDVDHDRGRTRAVLIDACHLLVEGPCDIRSCGPELASLRRGDRTLIGAASGFDADRIESDIDRAVDARLQWVMRAAAPEGVAALCRKTYRKAVSIMKGFVYAPEGPVQHHYVTPDRWPHRGMWLWDSAFQAIGLRHVDPAMAWDAVAAVLDTQQDDGLVPFMFRHEEPRMQTQPPTLAMAAQAVHRVAPDLKRLDALFPKLAAYLEWDMRHRDSDGAGLLEGVIETHKSAPYEARCAESGWDNSPRWDTDEPLDAVDFNSWLAHECEILAEFAGLLGLNEEQQKWADHHRRLCRLINERLWSVEKGFYLDCEAATGEQRPLVTAAGFLPLLCGAPDAAQAASLARHLHTTFDTAVPVSTVAPEHTDVYSKDMWRGPMWPNINWAIAEGFERYAMADEAALIRERTRAVIEKYYARCGSIFEFYDSADEVAPPLLPRKGFNNPDEWIHQVVYDYGWSAALYVDMCQTGR